jgi:gliding-associated putative ABC transporter substrate-binding component GldG
MKKLNSASILSVLFLLGILVMINAIGIRYFLRADLTSSKMYSLSKASKDVAAKLDDKVLIKVYFSPNLPSPLNTNERYLRDMLEDYRAFSHGKLQYEFVKPDDEKKFTEEAQNFGIPPRQIQSVANDKFEVKMAYMGLVVMFRDKKETLPVIERTDNLEYEITSLVKRLSAKKNPILGIATTSSRGEQGSMQKLYESLGRNYDVQPVEISRPIDKAVSALMVLAPRIPFTDVELYNIDQYIMNGGKVGMFMNSYRANLGGGGQQAMGMPINLNVNRFLANYGLSLDEDIVIDTKCNSVSSPAQQGFIKFMQTFQIPFMPIIQSFNKSNVITRDLQQVPTFFPSSVDTTLAKEKGYKVEGLLYTSGFSGRQSGPVVYIIPLNYMKKTDFLSKGIPLAAIVRGKFTSAFAQTGAPIDTTGAVSGQPLVTACAEENRLLVCGDGNMALDSFVQDPRQTLFIQNSADWLVQENDLISIRSKEVPVRPLKDIPDFLKKVVKWANLIAPSILIIICGIALWQARRIRKKALTAHYGESK